MTLRRQMILLIAVPTLIIYIAVLGVRMRYAYLDSKEAAQRQMTQLASSYAMRFDGQLREAMQIAQTTAAAVQIAGPPPDERIYQLLERDVSQSPLVYGACMAFEPGALKPRDVLFAPYVCRDGEKFRRVDINRSVYDWYRDPRYTWFTRPKAAGKGTWSEPYLDEGAGNILMATFSQPFDLNGKFGGVTTVDIDLPRLHKTTQASFSEALDFVILSEDGQFVFDPDASRIMRKSIFDVAKEKNQPELAKLGKTMLDGHLGVAEIDGWDSGQRQWVFYSPIKSTNWVFACRFPESKVLADVRRRTAWSAAAFAITLFLIVLAVVTVSRFVVAPIVRLKEKVQEVGKGNLDVVIDEVSGTDELKQLAQSFNQMTAQLRAQVERLGREQAARERIEHDLAIAREIQQNLLPAGDPKNPRFDIAGRSKYCDATGGDYFDFIDVAESPAGTTVVAVGDVTGHGIAAALLMASARAALRVQAADAPGQLSLMLNKVNRLLSSDNIPGRFMTMTLMVIDPDKLTVRWASAGHDPAIVFHPHNGRFEELDGADIPLGIFPETAYAEFTSKSLCPGDILLLGTDGIWETSNPAGEMFGKERLRDLIREIASRTASEMAEAIETRLDEYRGAGSQNDDITFVLIRIN
jgi:sigma-B regulation protein RsbU (phosphoserine phosphatase)